MPTFRYKLYMTDGSIQYCYSSNEVKHLNGLYNKVETEKITDEGWRTI